VELQIACKGSSFCGQVVVFEGSRGVLGAIIFTKKVKKVKEKKPQSSNLTIR